MNAEEVFLRTHRAKSWEKRTKGLGQNGEKDLDGEFIFWWIALNALYGQPREREDIRKRYQKHNIDELQNLNGFLQDVCSSPHILKVLTNSSIPNKRYRDNVLENPFLRKEYWNGGFSSGGLDSQII
jgi:hypothetical protein